MKISLDKAIELIRYEHPYAWAWELEDLCQWVAWFNKEHLLLCATWDGKTIGGLIMVRTVMKAEDGINNSLNYDPEGPVIFVDFIYAPTNEIKRGLVVQAIHRIVRRDLVAFQRNGTLRV